MPIHPAPRQPPQIKLCAFKLGHNAVLPHAISATGFASGSTGTVALRTCGSLSCNFARRNHRLLIPDRDLAHHNMLELTSCFQDFV